MWAIIAVGADFRHHHRAASTFRWAPLSGFPAWSWRWLLTHDLGIASSILAGPISLAVGVGIGMFNAFGIIRLGLPPFIMTLAMLTRCAASGC